MTTQEYKEQMEFLEQERTEIMGKIEALKREYLSLATFKPDQKVLVTHYRGESMAFIRYVDAHWLTKQYEYHFDDMKKDGTRSKKAVYFSGIKGIEHAPQ